MDRSLTGARDAELGFTIALTTCGLIFGLGYAIHWASGSTPLAFLLTILLTVPAFVKWTRYMNRKIQEEEAQEVAERSGEENKPALSDGTEGQPSSAADAAAKKGTSAAAPTGKPKAD
ncbi:MAG: hypothetical protein SGPRY_012120 [Prymnesium sp.]